MPNLDGIGLLAALAGREAYRSIPVVVVTEKDLTPEEEEFLGRSTLAVLRKSQRLEEALRAVLETIPR
jgi:CheY-like chemotaxis protein